MVQQTESRIAYIVDYTAAVAAGIEGVKAVSGAGTKLVEDPLRPGQYVASNGPNAVAQYTHWSEVPGAPDVDWVSQSGTVELTWMIPMRLWLPKSDEEARRTVMPFYDRYLRAFVRDPFLGAPPDGLVLRSQIKMMKIGGDDNWSWLDVMYLCVERVNYSAT